MGAAIYDLRGKAWPSDARDDLVQACEHLLARGIPPTEHNLLTRFGYTRCFLADHLAPAREEARRRRRASFQAATRDAVWPDAAEIQGSTIDLPQIAVYAGACWLALILSGFAAWRLWSELPELLP